MWRSILGRGATDNRTDSNGARTGAALAFMQTLLAACKRHNPTHGAVVFDGPGSGFRAALSPSYKGSRERFMPDGAAEQIPVMRKAVIAAGLQIYDSGIYEADDVLATLAYRAARAVILSDDKDLGAHVRGNDVVQQRHCDSKNGKPAPLLNEVAIRTRWGVDPRYVAELQALAGDTGDEVAGVVGIGPVAARRYIEQARSIERVALNVCDDASGKLWMQRAAAMHDVVRLAAMTRLVTNAVVPDVEPRRRDWPRTVLQFYQELGARATAKSFARFHGLKVPRELHHATATRSLFQA